MGNNNNPAPKTRLVEIGPGFWNIRAGFKMLKGLVDIGTHMSIIKLSNGKYLIIDTVPLNDELKVEIDVLTERGEKMEAVIATHPFHTLAFPAFALAYPKVPYYGTPRHLRKQKEIPWVGPINDPAILKKWEPDVQMRIPAGAEFNAPEPEAYNHFNSVWVFCPAARTVHIDDTINYFDNPGLLIKYAGGKKKGCMEFHDSIKGPGLYDSEDAPRQFKAWTEAIAKDWDFDNMCCAHTGNKIGGAKKLFEETISNSQHIFNALIEANKGKTRVDDPDAKDCANYNVDGNECG